MHLLLSCWHSLTNCLLYLFFYKGYSPLTIHSRCWLNCSCVHLGVLVRTQWMPRHTFTLLFLYIYSLLNATVMYRKLLSYRILGSSLMHLHTNVSYCMCKSFSYKVKKYDQNKLGFKMISSISFPSFWVPLLFSSVCEALWSTTVAFKCYITNYATYVTFVMSLKLTLFDFTHLVISMRLNLTHIYSLQKDSKKKQNLNKWLNRVLNTRRDIILQVKVMTNK